MKVELRCAPCILHRGYLEIKEATNNQSLRFEAISNLLNFIAEGFKPTANPAHLGTQRDRLIRKVTGNPDPFAEIKRLSNQKALETLPLVEKIMSGATSEATRFRKACVCSIVGNTFEADIPDHTFEFGGIEKLIQGAERDLTIDEISEIFNQVEKAEHVLYLTDNAGEIAFDTLLVRELKRIGPSVTVAVKGGPILNDATLEDAKYVGMHEVADNIITTGIDAVGLVPNECSEEFLSIYTSAEFVVAKGMGYAETITELDLSSPHALLLRTKCTPVANFFKVDKERNIAKLIF